MAKSRLISPTSLDSNPLLITQYCVLPRILPTVPVLTQYARRNHKCSISIPTVQWDAISNLIHALPIQLFPIRNLFKLAQKLNSYQIPLRHIFFFATFPRHFPPLCFSQPQSFPNSLSSNMHPLHLYNIPRVHSFPPFGHNGT